MSSSHLDLDRLWPMSRHSLALALSTRTDSMPAVITRLVEHEPTLLYVLSARPTAGLFHSLFVRPSSTRPLCSPSLIGLTHSSRHDQTYHPSSRPILSAISATGIRKLVRLRILMLVHHTMLQLTKGSSILCTGTFSLTVTSQHSPSLAATTLSSLARGKKVDVIIDVDETEPPKSLAEIKYRKDANEWLDTCTWISRALLAGDERTAYPHAHQRQAKPARPRGGLVPKTPRRRCAQVLSGPAPLH
ncbi:hypothetical protein BCR44DRAFT_1281626 [Catenaria anguillulae PL171]|uniref:Uncharacterized protein n=1 Tax=Catenaria anguillulae PL171 TaxID=765915 RepID=A0A1Y2HXV1_9FUNG|nr:hypothetical protein BCR44DRAFT_1281626 [Catenaria anguillulae PL171]